MNGLHSDNGKVTLCTPNLSSFKTNDYMFTDYTLRNLSFIDTADIQYTSVRKNKDAPPEFELPIEIKELFAKRLIEFLRAVHNVKDLKLSCLSLECPLKITASSISQSEMFESASKPFKRLLKCDNVSAGDYSNYSIY
ncbi:hypothetical protein MKX01_007344 [Papaver californicum]|nr:hypothetical protein MKX01_007344 [Papaver californicum]